MLSFLLLLTARAWKISIPVFVATALCVVWIGGTPLMAACYGVMFAVWVGIVYEFLFGT